MEERRNRRRFDGSVPIRGASPASPPGPIPAGIRAGLRWFARVQALCTARFGRIDEWHVWFRNWLSGSGIGKSRLPGCDGEVHASLTG